MFTKYIEGTNYGVQTMTSNSYGDIIPLQIEEKVFSTFIMILGATVMGNLFGTFAAIIEEINYLKIENRKKKERTQD